MDITGMLMGEITSNPAIQAAVLGLAVKVGVDKLKGLFVTLDADGTKQYKVQVQALVAVCTLIATLGDMYVNGKLGTADPHMVTDFFTVSLPVYLSAMGFHLFGKDVKKEIAKVKTQNGK